MAMTTSDKDLQSSAANRQDSFPWDLLIGWACGLLSGFGLLLPVAGIIAVAAAAIATFGFGVFSRSAWMCSLALVGLATAALGPILWAKRRTRHWGSALVGGVLATVLGLVLLIPLYALLETIPADWWKLDLAQGLVGLVIGIYASSTLLTVNLINGQHQTGDWSGILPGVLVGLGLAFMSGVIWKAATPDGLGNIFVLMIQIPPMVWASIVMSPNPVDHRSLLRDFGIWAALVLITYALPFILGAA